MKRYPDSTGISAAGLGLQVVMLLAVCCRAEANVPSLPTLLEMHEQAQSQIQSFEYEFERDAKMYNSSGSVINRGVTKGNCFGIGLKRLSKVHYENQQGAFRSSDEKTMVLNNRSLIFQFLSDPVIRQRDHYSPEERSGDMKLAEGSVNPEVNSFGLSRSASTHPLRDYLNNFALSLESASVVESGNGLLTITIPINGHPEACITLDSNRLFAVTKVQEFDPWSRLAVEINVDLTQISTLWFPSKVNTRYYYSDSQSDPMYLQSETITTVSKQAVNRSYSDSLFSLDSFTPSPNPSARLEIIGPDGKANFYAFKNGKPIPEEIYRPLVPVPEIPGDKRSVVGRMEAKYLLYLGIILVAIGGAWSVIERFRGVNSSKMKG